MKKDVKIKKEKINWLKDKRVWILGGVIALLIIIGILLFMFLTNPKQQLRGKWMTKYELGMYGEVTQTYEFKNNEKCKKTLKTDLLIELDCTYTITKDKIHVEYQDGQKTTLSYQKKDKGYMIDGYIYTKQK